MKLVNYISNLAMPLVILIIVFYAIYEKKNVFDIFLKGAKEGIEVVVKIFPTLIGLFLAIGLLRDSGIIDLIIKIIKPIISLLKIPTEILPLAMLRPISGSASIAVATDIMKQYGVDTTIGIITSVIMGATETTFYTIAVYSSSVNIKNTRFVLCASLIADFVGIIGAVIICQILS